MRRGRKILSFQRGIKTAALELVFEMHQSLKSQLRVLYPLLLYSHLKSWTIIMIGSKSPILINPSTKTKCRSNKVLKRLMVSLVQPHSPGLSQIVCSVTRIHFHITRNKFQSKNKITPLQRSQRMINLFH